MQRSTDPFGSFFKLEKVMASKAQNAKSTVELGSINVRERITPLFEPDTLLSAQYMENLRRKTLFEPEKRLMLAMLEDAIYCFQAYVTAQGRRGQKLFNDAEKWIMMTDDDWIFSFVNVCETLGFSPEYVRQGVRRWRQKKLSNSTPAEGWRQKRMTGRSRAPVANHGFSTDAMVIRLRRPTCDLTGSHHQRCETK
jgi:tRNA U34 5-methylaminomethyl-2-thiouridine-forming methyltransferase MnmC